MKMTEYKLLTIEECIDRLLKIERPLVVMHKNPDADTVGSAAALADIFEMLGRQAYYLCPDEIPQRLSFLLDSLSPAKDLRGLTPIAVDIASPAMLGKYKDSLPFELMIDHHEIGVIFADCYKIPGASSVGEVIFDIALLLEGMGKITMTKKLAEHLFAAMSSDTGAFRYSNATEDTYKKAAMLLSLGIDHARISHLLYFSKSREQILAEEIASKNLKTAHDGKIAYSYVSADELSNYKLSLSDFDTGIDVVRSLIGVRIALFAKQTAEGEFKVSLRSIDDDVSKVAQSFGGGGHVRAAGCTVRAATAEAAISKIILEIENNCQ